MAHGILATSVIAVLIISVGVSAKRGCSAFGHSCYGGHGKRSDSSIDPVDIHCWIMGFPNEHHLTRLSVFLIYLLTNTSSVQKQGSQNKKFLDRSLCNNQSSSPELLGRRQMGQAETPPHPIYPQPYGILPSGDDIIPVRDGGVFDREGGARDAVKMKLRNMLRYWMDYYRRSRQSNDDGYLFESI